MHKVADALGLPPSEVEQLLDQSRQGGSPIRDFKVVLGVVALIFAFMLGVGTTSVFGHREVPPTVASVPVVPSSSGVFSARPRTMVGGEAVRAIPAAIPVVTSAEPSQLTGQLGALEAKTNSGDVRRAVEKARLLRPTFAQDDPTNGPVQTMPASAISR